MCIARPCRPRRATARALRTRKTIGNGDAALWAGWTLVLAEGRAVVGRGQGACSMPQTAALLALLALAASSSSLTTASSAVSSSLSRYRVVSNQQWPSCCIRPKPGCVGPPTLPNQSIVNLPDFAKWHIEPNPGLTFNGPVVATLYSFGRIPRYTGMGPGGACHDGDWNCTNATAVFGGLPQLANLTAHLQQLRKDIEYSFPDPDWNGLAAGAQPRMAQRHILRDGSPYV